MKALAVALYCAALLAIGYFASKRMKDLRDYFAGGKKLGFINVAFSARATGESAWLLLGLTGMGYLLGAQAFWVVVGELIGVGGAWLLMSRRFKRLTDRYDSVTVPDYLESRFRDSAHLLRVISAIALVVFVPIYAGAQVQATGKAFNSFFGIDLYLGALIGFLIVLFYITKGGFVAVVWSDVFQGSLMFLGLVCLPIVAILELGGVTKLLDTLRALSAESVTANANDASVEVVNYLSMTGGQGWTPLTIASVIGLAAIGIGFFGSPQVFVRFISLRSEKEINKGAGVALTWTLFADSGAVLIGMAGRAIYTPAQVAGSETITDGYAENILPLMSTQLLPAFFAGAFIAMVLSAIMSTIDSLLVVASSAAVRDFWQKTKRPDLRDEDLVKLSQRTTLVLALIAFGIGIGMIRVSGTGEIFWAIIFGWSGIAATFCPVMILSLFWRGLTKRGAAASMIAGFLAVPFVKWGLPALLTKYISPEATEIFGALDVLLPAFAIAMAVGIVTSILDPSGREKLVGIDEDFDYAKHGDKQR